MSVQATCQTNISDESALIEALEEILGKNNIKVVAEGVAVEGYSSEKQPTVLVRVDHLYGTAGYLKNKEGTYELVYDSMDARKLSKLIPQKSKTGVTDVLSQTYVKIKIKKAMKNMCGRVVQDEIDEEGTIRMKVKVRHYE